MWKMYSVMKRIFSLACIVLCLSSVLFAEKIAELSLRFTRQDNLVRVVIEGEAEVIDNANTVISTTSVRVDLPVPFDLKKPADFIFETAKKDRSLFIATKNVTDTRSYKLSSPSRIVIEMKTLPTSQQQREELKAPDAKKQPMPGPPPVQQAGDQGQTGPAKPLPAAPPSPPAATLKTIVIDPGHGGYDYGMFTQDFREKDFSLAFAKDLSAQFLKKGIKVVLTRKADQSLSLEERISTANTKSADLFLSIHATPTDAFAITTAFIDDPGTDAVIRLYKLSLRQNRHLDKSRTIARSIGDAITADFKPGAVVRELPLPVLSSLDAPAIFIEYPITAKKTVNQKERDRLITAIIKGVIP
jgi:N-acetylmuramoyl-L-alanine amidase